MEWVYLSVASLSVLFFLAVLGLFSNAYRENWFQHLGLVGIGITSVSSIFNIKDMEWVSPGMAVFIFAAMLYGVGTALKVWKFYRAEIRSETPTQS